MSGTNNICFGSSEESAELNLIMDCKTRWNSMVAMVERFLYIIEQVRTALKDMGSFLLDENYV